MVSGAFKSFKHEHVFEIKGNVTLMTDKFYFESPLGMLGKLANRLFLKRYMIQLLQTRNQLLKEKAERS
jgi:ligand-binding SRPBCC domain-containing protein